MEYLDKRIACGRVETDSNSCIVKLLCLVLFSLLVFGAFSTPAMGSGISETDDDSFSDLFSEIFEKTSSETARLRDAMESPDSPMGSSGLFSRNTCEMLSEEFDIVDLERIYGRERFRYRTEKRLSKCDVLRGYFRLIDQSTDVSNIAEDRRAISINDYRAFDHNGLNDIILKFGLSEEDFDVIIYDLVTLESGVDEIVEFRSFYEYMVTVPRIYNRLLPVPDSYMRFAFDDSNRLKRALVKWPSIQIDFGGYAKSDIEIASEIYASVMAFMPKPEFSEIRIESIIAESICGGASNYYPAFRVAVVQKGSAGVEFDVGYYDETEDIQCGDSL
ncbi:MAG: hypothetical protein IT350_08295 [Deltaproteobacteria bacterium]|nr:hypothetical protein [Deltaproteobacteria bacterium]